MKIKTYLSENNIKQKDLAQALNIAPSHLSNWIKADYQIITIKGDLMIVKLIRKLPTNKGS